MKTSTALCLDLGGTSLKMGIVQGGKLLASSHAKTDVSCGIAGIKATYMQAANFAKDYDFDFVSVSSAGRIDSQSGVCTYATETLPDYTGFHISGFSESVFHKPTFAINDGYAAGLGEYFASGSTSGTMLMLTIGTGLGGVIIQNGTILNFPKDRDMGHLELVPGGLPCTCGRLGCMECYASGTALNAALAPFEHSSSARANRWQKFLAKEPPISTAVRSWLMSLTSAIDKIHSLHPFDTVVLGGGVADDGAYWFITNLFNGKPYTARLSTLGNTAGLIGAYYFGLEKFSSSKCK